LRERGDDVLLLIRHFLRTHAARRGTPPPPVPTEVLRALSTHAWPGNVRQLESEIGRLVVYAGAEAARMEHLSPEITHEAPPRPRTLDDARTAWERELLRRALDAHGGNRTRAASALAITRQALLAKIRRYGL